jgi:hypothetical protein
VVLRACRTDRGAIADAVSVLESQPFGALGLFDADTRLAIERVVLGTSGALLRLAHIAIIHKTRRAGGRSGHAGLALPYGRGWTGWLRGGDTDFAVVFAALGTDGLDRGYALVFFADEAIGTSGYTEDTGLAIELCAFGATLDQAGRGIGQWTNIVEGVLGLSEGELPGLCLDRQCQDKCPEGL